MINFQLRRVQQWVDEERSEVVERALAEFRKLAPKSEEVEPEFVETVEGIWREWLIYEYRDKPISPPLIVEYAMLHRHELTDTELHELMAICKTNFYEQLEITGPREKGEWIEMYGMTTGRKYRVYDVALSKNAPKFGTTWGRLAKINRRWNLVGTDTIVLPLTTTARMKAMMRKELKREKISCTTVLEMLTKHEPAKVITKKEIKNKRKTLEKQYQKLQLKSKILGSFEDLIARVWSEKRSVPFGDWLQDSTKDLQIPDRVLIQNLSFFQDVWNYFPHKVLGGKAPIEVFPDISN